MTETHCGGGLTAEKLYAYKSVKDYVSKSYSTIQLKHPVLFKLTIKWSKSNYYFIKNCFQATT